MSAASQYEGSKDWFGRRSVKYECPYCGDRLRSPLRDAGIQDYCPTCQRGYTVPGREVLNHVTVAKQAAIEYAERIKGERQEVKRLRELERTTARAQAMKAAEDARYERERLAEEARQRQALVDASAQPNSDPKTSAKFHRMWWTTGGVAATAVVLVWVYSVRHGAELRSQLDQCESKDVVAARVNYYGFFNNDTVVFDLREGASSGARRIDPVHLLMQFASKLDLATIRRVILARNGEPRFYISGSDLRRLADSYAGGGRIWAFNNLPANVRRTDGTRAFDEWTGGWIGVLKQQTEDLNNFITEWTGYGDSGYSAISNGANSTVGSRRGKTVWEMEDNVAQMRRILEQSLKKVAIFRTIGRQKVLPRCLEVVASAQLKLDQREQALCVQIKTLLASRSET